MRNRKPVRIPQTDPSPNEVNDKIVHETMQQTSIFTGPLPPPNLLSQYNQIIPKGADRIMIMAESEQAHRHDLENTIVKSEVIKSYLGLILAAIVALFFGAGSFYLIGIGKNIEGMATIILNIGTLIGSFIYIHKKRDKENSKDNKLTEV